MATKDTPKSNKRILIDKNNASMVLVIAAMAFVTVFSIISSRALLNQRSYQSRVIKEQLAALNQLKKNNEAAKQLVGSYTSFVAADKNIIKGSKSGSDKNDGDNAKIVLDALPSKYDFPAITATLERVLLDQNFKINEFTGTDDEVAQDSKASKTPTTTPVEIPFSVSVTGSFDSAQVLMDTLQHSIRPIRISTLSLDGSNDKLNLKINAKTYYLPEKTINFTTKVVK